MALEDQTTRMMTPRRFWYLLSLTTAITVAGLYLTDLVLPELSAWSSFILLSTLVFVLINILACFAGIRSVRSASRFRFIHLMMGLIVFKMGICVLLVLAHMQINRPESKLFVIPFLLIYLIFTFLEIFVLEKIARTTSAQRPDDK